MGIASHSHTRCKKHVTTSESGLLVPDSYKLWGDRLNIFQFVCVCEVVTELSVQGIYGFHLGLSYLCFSSFLPVSLASFCLFLTNLSLPVSHLSLCESLTFLYLSRPVSHFSLPVSLLSLAVYHLSRPVSHLSLPVSHFSLSLCLSLTSLRQSPSSLYLSLTCLLVSHLSLYLSLTSLSRKTFQAFAPSASSLCSS